MRWLFYLTLFLLPLVVLLLGDSGEPEVCLVPPLVTAAEKGDLAAVEELLGKAGCADLRDSCEWTPLMKAALNGHREIVEKLVAHGAQIDAEDEGGYTALMLAASNNHVDIVEMLIEAGADINHTEHTRGWTALSWAARQGHEEVVAVLRRYGVTVKDLPRIPSPPRETTAWMQGGRAKQEARAEGRGEGEK